MTAEELPDDIHVSIAERLRRRTGADVDPRIDLPEQGSRREPLPSASTTATAPTQVLARLGARGAMASRYRVNGEIARGGMGAILDVYDEDLRRRLAMKVVLDRAGGADGSAQIRFDPALLARFLEEAQVTGQLDHPGIVPVHELGLDANGRVYFTMRLVHGRNLEAIFRLVPSESEGWTTTRACGVLLKVCEAMAYAHAKGVVHRDLKPANVMVGQFGEVYVMDWGLARVRDHADRHDVRPREGADARAAFVETDRREHSGAALGDNLYTMDGDVMGTPSFMSPEQARGKLAEIGEASDVYSLGAMLYRLLAGVEPYRSREQRVGAIEVLKRLREGPPTPLEELTPGAPPELIAICEKAMAGDVGARYPNMLALGDDLRAFLEGRVVAAFETGAWAQARKWVKRNQGLSAALAATVLALVVGLIASVTFERRSTRNAALAEERRVAAEASAQVARRQARVAEEANAFLNVDLLAAVAPEKQGRDVTVREVLDQASTNLSGRFRDEPEVEAALRLTIGTSYAKLGAYPAAYEHVRRAYDLRSEHEGEPAETTLAARFELAVIEAELGRTDESIARYREGLAIARESLGLEHPATLTAMNDFAIVLRDADRLDEARDLYEELVDLEERVYGADAADTLTTQNNLALIDQDLGHFAEAAERLEFVLDRQRATQSERSPAALITLGNLAQVLAELGRLDKALELGREALDLALDVHGPDHPLTARTRGNLAMTLQKLGRFEEALEMANEALRATRAAYGDEHRLTFKARGNVASVLLDMGRAEQALGESLAVLAGQRQLLGDRHPDTLDSLNRAAMCYLALDRLDEALPLARENLAAQREEFGADHPMTLMATENLANILFRQDDYAASEELTREVLAGRRRVLGEQHPDVAKTTFNLGMVLRAKGDTAEALEQFEASIALWRARNGAADALTIQCLRRVGELRAAAGEHDAALRASREALELEREANGDGELSATLQHQIGVSQLALGDGEGALASLETALAWRESSLGERNVATWATQLQIARALVKLGRYADAEVRALELHERVSNIEGAASTRTSQARALLVELYEAWGRADDAARWR